MSIHSKIDRYPLTKSVMINSLACLPTLPSIAQATIPRLSLILDQKDNTTRSTHLSTTLGISTQNIMN